QVYINDQKYACESCIKGHRSSSCQHADRPLFEIKKKGRPVSQCEKCRELRKTKRMHNKCNCSALSSSTATSHPIVGESSTKPMSKCACVENVVL
ncbi:copper-fist-domain-containing protein, partial [Laetiporus sulphureus 93-53]